MRLEYKDFHNGYEYVIIVQDMGYRCGYVNIPENHPWYNLSFEDIYVCIHGGLTFASLIKNDHPILENGYWIGFDCMHWMDLPDPDEMSKECLNQYGYKIFNYYSKLESNLKIRNFDYVKSQCCFLCDSCAEVDLIEKSYNVSK